MSITFSDTIQSPLYCTKLFVKLCYHDTMNIQEGSEICTSKDKAFSILIYHTWIKLIVTCDWPSSNLCTIMNGFKSTTIAVIRVHWAAARHCLISPLRCMISQGQEPIPYPVTPPTSYIILYNCQCNLPLFSSLPSLCPMKKSWNCSLEQDMQLWWQVILEHPSK